MQADPEPQHPIFRVDAERTIRAADSDGPIWTDSFEVERRMTWIRFQQLKIFALELLHFGRKRFEVLPEARRCAMTQSSFVLPSR